MRKSLIHLFITGLIASITVVMVTRVNACPSDPHCLYLPQSSGGTGTISIPSATATAMQTPSPTTPAPTATPTLSATRPILKGLAILGDSTQDEYQADNPRGGEYHATTLNWVEQLQRFRGVNLGPPGTHPEPRRSGYAYNWARSGATSDDMIRKGQHTGVAEQITQGLVSHVAIQIGINDFFFSGLGMATYEGTISGITLTRQLDQIVTNITVAARTAHMARPQGVLLMATQDYLTLPLIPEVQIQYSDPIKRQRMINALAYINTRLKIFAAEEKISYFDYNAAMQAELNARTDQQGFLIMGQERIDLQHRGDEPHFGLLDDQYVHPGTVLSGLSANVYITALNQAFGAQLPLLTDQDILRNAGIKP